MNETSKTRAVRPHNFDQLYLQGRVIDIGCGDDLVCEWAERFDVEDGDANDILSHRALESYDAVHSSHCLEHMHDPVAALAQWWSLVKPGGFLILVVPDEDLYEQGCWPSQFNSDHKWTFRLDKKSSWSPVSHEIRSLVATLPNAKTLGAEIHDHGYDYTLQAKCGDPVREPTWLIGKMNRKIRKANIRESAKVRLWRAVDKYARYRNVLVDQTMRDALAQIQVIAQKVGG